MGAIKMELINGTQSTKSLVSPRRNRYYYGKLLDEYHFQLEQSYMNEKRRLLNRLGLGNGVLCGLEVTPAEGRKVVIHPGAAIDLLGREIVVPDPFCLEISRDLLEKDGDLGDSPIDNAIPVTLCLAYHECETDHTPVMACGCDVQETSMPSTVQERFKLFLRPGLPSRKPGRLTADQCRKIFPADPPEGFDRRNTACRCLSGECILVDDHCVVLATLLVPTDEENSIQIDTCTYRPVVYSNAMLMDLILCLARRLDACCDQAPPDLIAPRLTQIDFLDTSGNKIGSLESPTSPAKIPAEESMAQFRMVFNAAMDPDSFFTGTSQDDPIHFSVLVTDLADQSAVPGRIEFENDRMVLFVLDYDDSRDSFSTGRYQVTLFGDEDETGARFAIAGQNDVRFDGESTQLPSGDGSEGGNFIFEFEIVEEKAAFAIQDVFFGRSDGKSAGQLKSPSVPYNIPYSGDQAGVNRISVKFTSDVDPKTVIAGDENTDPETINFLVTATPLKEPPQLKNFIPGGIKVLSDNQVEFVAAKELVPGAYHVTLFGNKDPLGKRIPIMNRGGKRLDGEPISIPSGDGNEGGDFTFRFVIGK